MKSVESWLPETATTSRPSPAMPGASRRASSRAARVAEVADEEHGLVAGVVAQRVERDAVVVQVGGEQRRAGVVDAARRRVGEQRGEAARRRPGPCSRTRRPPCARSRRRPGAARARRRARRRWGGRGRARRSSPGPGERRPARDGGDREDGRPARRRGRGGAARRTPPARARASAPAAPRRRGRSAACAGRSCCTAVRRPASVALTGARAPLAARMTTSRSTVRGSRCSRIGARKAWKRTPQSASGM